MHFGFFFALFCILLILTETAHGRDLNKTKSITDSLKKINLKEKSLSGRNKRSLEDYETQNWPNKGKRVSYPDDVSKFKNVLGRNVKVPNSDVLDKDSPFWGSRGRRDSASVENDVDDGPPLRENSLVYSAYCEHCYKFPFKYIYGDNQKERREEQDIPFWGNRGRRNSGEADDNNYATSGSKARRQEDDPFWGARGRREDEVPFWGNRGRRFNWEIQDSENPPFWGNRGRRDEVEPFWGSRGRRQQSEPFWTIQGKDSKNNRRESLKKVLHDAINTVEDNIESLTRVRRDNSYTANSFWGSRGVRDNKLSKLFKLGRQKLQIQRILDGVRPELNSVQDDRIFAEQPSYILVERSSRSSAEDDPFYISRGKKMIVNYEPAHSSRYRRGSVEELVKSIRNDPYYIARGKKYAPVKSDIKNSTSLPKELGKAQELICATIDLILHAKGNKKKREVGDNDRDRRTILKKLAAQLQVDPYFVSRGKKNESDFNDDSLEDFFNGFSVKCN